MHPARSGRALAMAMSLLLNGAMILYAIWQPVRHTTPHHESLVTVQLLAPTPPVAPVPDIPRPKLEHVLPDRSLMRQLERSPLPVGIEEMAPLVASESSDSHSIEPPPVPLPPAKPTSAVPTDYVALLAQRLATVKRYPRAARALRQQGTVLLAFRLDRTGRLLAWHIAHSSGFQDLDDEVAAMIAAAAPFAPFPSSMKNPVESFTVPIEFSLQ